MISQITVRLYVSCLKTQSESLLTPRSRPKDVKQAKYQIVLAKELRSQKSNPNHNNSFSSLFSNNLDHHRVVSCVTPRVFFLTKRSLETRQSRQGFLPVKDLVLCDPLLLISHMVCKPQDFQIPDYKTEGRFV